MKGDKMFCKKCGNEIKTPGQQFCPNCGEPLSEAAPNPAPAPASNPVPSVNMNQFGSSGIGGSFGTKALPVLAIALVAIHVLQLIFWFCDALYIEASIVGYKQTMSMKEVCVMADAKPLTTITVVALIIAIVINVVEIIGKRIPGGFIIGILVCLWYGLFPVGEKINLVNSQDELGGFGGGLVQAGLTFVGWLMILLAIAAIVIYIMGVVQAKKK